MMADRPANEIAIETRELSGQIERVLYGRGAAVQGAVLADLAAIYFAGHHPAVREAAIAQWLALMRNLIPPSEQQRRERGDYPPGWLKQ
jgi:hypothetical protein